MVEFHATGPAQHKDAVPRLTRILCRAWIRLDEELKVSRLVCLMRVLPRAAWYRIWRANSVTRAREP